MACDILFSEDVEGAAPVFIDDAGGLQSTASASLGRLNAPRFREEYRRWDGDRR
ncbi:MAG: hypothetical protein ACTHU1_04690 [Arachnia sp.]